METRLKIVWDGDASGLSQHRLSLAEFGPALTHLLGALRRIASGIITQAQDGSDSGLRGGRLAKLASQLDLQVSTVEEGSLGLVMACVLGASSGQNAELFRTLPDQACTEFLSAVEQESAGQLRNGMVRKFLGALPASVTSQAYTVKRSDGEERTVRIGQMQLAALAPDAPELDEVVASIVGAGFEPGRLEVRLLESDSKRTLVCSASQRQVERALALRSQPVRALIVTTGGKSRLLRLRGLDEATPTLTTSARESLLWLRWDELMRRFAE